MTHVFVLDTWDNRTHKARRRVFSSKEDANRALNRFLEPDPKGFTLHGEVGKLKAQ